MINIFISKCLCIETANKNCETVVPKDILAKPLTTISILSLLTSLTHKNRKKSQSHSLTDTFKNSCLMSLIGATLYERNLIKISINFGSRFGPVSRH